MGTKTEKGKEQALVTVETPGARPPCTDRLPGQCRGCFGWDHMLEALKRGKYWEGAVVRCDITGLTVRTALRKNPGRKKSG